MKKNIAITILILCFFQTTFSQANERIQPRSVSVNAQSLTELKEVVLPGITPAELAKSDMLDSKNGHMPKFARSLTTQIDLANSGTWSTIPGGRIWRIKITSNGALGLVPLFDKLYLPKGATLHVYTPGKEQILGAFTNDNTPEERAFCPGIVAYESCIVECFEPTAQTGKSILSINQVAHAYRWIQPITRNEKSGSQSCEVNVVCPEGTPYSDQIRGVARIMVITGDGAGFCSGSLVNNVRQDCTPYLLSAQHCSEGGVTAAQFLQWVFYFNYQATTCNGTSSNVNQTVNGCYKVADSQDGGGDRGSDFLLLRLKNSPPSAYNVYYNGWDSRNIAPASGVAIHHPNADIKKISAFSSTALSRTWGDTAQDTHWQVQWVATTSGHGVTEPGSSGSPLINPDGLVIGHLTGGNSCCTNGTCGFGSGPNVPDLFGKLSFDWTSNGTSNSIQAKPWLDPDNTGTQTLQGMNPSCGGSVSNDAGIVAASQLVQNLCGTTDTPVVVLKNYGANNLTTVTINYSFDNGNVYQYVWHGTLAPGETVNVSLPAVTLTTGLHSFSVQTISPNGTSDNNNSNDFMSTSYYVSSASCLLHLFLATDNYGSQTSWDITDASSNIIASGNNYADYLGGQEFDYYLCVQPGCYTFTIHDANGNGMHSGEDGNFVLNGVGTYSTNVYASLNTPSFGSSEVHQFCVDATGIDENNALKVGIVPNPSNGVFKLMFDGNNEKQIRVYDALGRLIAQKTTSERSLSLDLSNTGKGVYILEAETTNGKSVQKLVVN